MDGLAALIIPDTEYINESFQSFLEELKFKFNFNTDFFSSVFQHESVVSDVTVDYVIPGVNNNQPLHLDIFDSEYFIKVVLGARHLIRGYIAFLIILYNIRQLIGFFGYDAGVVAGRSEWVSYATGSYNKKLGGDSK